MNSVKLNFFFIFNASVGTLFFTNPRLNYSVYNLYSISMFPYKLDYKNIKCLTWNNLLTEIEKCNKIKNKTN